MSCSGIAALKDPFGTYECSDTGCTCVRGGTKGTCDSSGNNCKECPSPPPSGSQTQYGAELDVWADTAGVLDSVAEPTDWGGKVVLKGSVSVGTLAP